MSELLTWRRQPDGSDRAGWLDLVLRIRPPVQGDEAMREHYRPMGNREHPCQQKWIAKPKGRFTLRHEKALRRAGFAWDGCDWIRESADRPHKPWGCIVAKYKAPPHPRKGVGVIIGMMIGTHDEFGKPISAKHPEDGLDQQEKGEERQE